MDWPLPTGAGKKLLLVVAVTLILQQSTANATHGAGGSNSLAKPGCPDRCGNLSIPYPFGIGEGCFRKGFNVTCDETEQAAYLGTEKTFKVFDINLSQGEARVQKYIAFSCDKENDDTGLPEYDQESSFRYGHSFTISNTKNKFTAIGCATIAIIQGKNEHAYTSACGSFCSEDSIENSTECTGMGCCQTSIPDNLRHYQITFLTVRGMNYSAVKNFSPCSYAFVAETDWFKFSTSYAKSTEFAQLYSGVPMVLDWVVDNKTCGEAQKMESYACLAMNSTCIDVQNGLGYRCNCPQGYEGNPYINGGCQDINECDHPSLYPCRGNCSNTFGSYNCLCPPGTHSDDPKTIPCSGLPSPDQPEVKFVIGISTSIIFVIVCIFVLLIKCQRRKLAKEKKRFFKQNGGQILYQQILSKQVDTVIIFTIEDLKKATNNFDKSRELGTGGQGTVYKGILKDNKVVAVKRSKMMDLAQTEEFVQEIIILSQINHKNVVRLLGCCLEVEVPILVYEFIPNGTLFHLIHGNNAPISLEARLRIAQESAEALAYLHLSTNRPIVHGDVKSLNILLDENGMAKVIDFGASRMLPKDAVQLMTIVQGTLGYLDPEYLQERKLTEKSDVYSFGVILLELITRKKAVYSEGTEEVNNLASCFLLAMKENRVQGILDKSIASVGTEELLQQVAELARHCLSIKGEERPSMAQVADKLKAIRSSWSELLLLQHNETEVVIGQGVALADLSPSMYWTARMLGMDIETPYAVRAGSTNTTTEYV
ncbi:unnamed protein product [Urochloa decumbens]|uniref:Protein kinase domain-containing protein n=1 Tax=Urochloa decumbens TaxID=240449 RepID=A0ABC9HFI6_9POAL